MRPWYRIHCSTLSILAVVLAGFVFINLPGDNLGPWRDKFSHGWPYVYFQRHGAEGSFWSFTGKGTKFRAPELMGNVLTALCIVALVACPCELWIRRHGRLFRFGIRSMFVVTALVAVVMGLSVQKVQRRYRQQHALAELAQYGSVSTGRRQQPYDWLWSLLGDYAHGTIESVSFAATSPFGRLPDLHDLRDVDEIWLELRNVPAGMEELGELPTLKRLSVKLTSAGRADLKHLTALSEVTQLGFLWLAGDEFDDRTLTAISPRSQVEMLWIESPDIGWTGLRRLGELNALVHVALDERVLQQPDSVLQVLGNLRSVRFEGNKLTSREEQKVRRLWPNANVERRPYGEFRKSSLDVWSP
jgi:hypothetical protein